ncbi:transcription factor AP-4 isoform X1 [Nymphalis io]|uniref:transcription factor AP-4 isoform X1 n=2 Tax=Inachis io TaxID=171585 RepID=UPI00216905E8|nr:transcription factor AP-4 isoform X1 [Nymphalis io]
MSLHGNDVCLLEIEDYNLYEEEASDHASSRSEKNSSPGSKTMEAEKRIRREIANSNERRRMQSINAGFQALRTLLPRHEGEKLSKAAILQQTAEYIYSLEQEKTRLLSQNCQLKRLLNQHEGGDIPIKKRKNEVMPVHVPSIIPDSTDDTLTSSISPEPVAVITVSNMSQKKEPENSELRVQLEREQRLRRLLEERLHSLESQVYTESDKELPPPVVHYEETDIAECKLEKEEGESKLVETPVVAPLLEAAIKAEPRVEVEVLPDATHDASSRLYLASTSRQNLETIVEAIRHLEGDHLFREETGDAPLALTKKVDRAPPQRPGVIVVKHS